MGLTYPVKGYTRCKPARERVPAQLLHERVVAELVQVQKLNQSAWPVPLPDDEDLLTVRLNRAVALIDARIGWAGKPGRDARGTPQGQTPERRALDGASRMERDSEVSPATSSPSELRYRRTASPPVAAALRPFRELR